MNKKIIFLSFRPEFFRPILYDIKKYYFLLSLYNIYIYIYIYIIKYRGEEYAKRKT